MASEQQQQQQQQQQQEVVEGAPGMLPPSSAYLGAAAAHGAAGMYGWETAAPAPQPVASEAHDGVKMEEAGGQGGAPQPAGASVPMSAGGVAVEEQAFYVGGEGSGVPTPPAVVGAGMQAPLEMPSVAPPLTLSMSTVAPVTMMTSQGVPLGGLEVVQQMPHEQQQQQQQHNTQHPHQQHLQQLQQQQAIVIAPGQAIPQQQPLLVGPVSLEDLRSAVQQFAVERDWDKFHTPRNLLCALVGEVGELSEIFQWRGEVEPGLAGFSDEEKSHVAQELADILLYLVRLSDICGFDLGQAALNKLQLNAQKYPPELCRGSAAKYNVYNQRQRYDTPPHTKLDEESGRKRQRERFTEDQVQAMTQLAERAQWSITAISWEERVKFCEEYGVTKERLSNFFNNRKPKEMKKGRTSRTPLPQLNDSSNQAAPMTAALTEEDTKVQAQIQAMANQQIHLQTLHSLQPVQQHLQQLQVLHPHQHAHPQVGDMEHQHMEHQQHMEGVEHVEHQHVEHQHVQQPDPQAPQAISPPAPA